MAAIPVLTWSRACAGSSLVAYDDDLSIKYVILPARRTVGALLMVERAERQAPGVSPWLASYEHPTTEEAKQAAQALVDAARP